MSAGLLLALPLAYQGCSQNSDPDAGPKDATPDQSGVDGKAKSKGSAKSGDDKDASSKDENSKKSGDASASPQDTPEPSDTPESPEEDPGEDSADTPEPSVKFDLGELPEGSKPDKGGGTEVTCDLDFLFVIDNSRSMFDEQVNLANSVPKFIETIQSGIDNLESFQVGVISTDANPNNAAGPGGDGRCNQMGGLTIRARPGENPAGPLVDCGPYANGKNFMTKADDMGKAFDCAAKIGSTGDGDEKPMDALFAAISPKLTKKGACNEGLFRKDAILVVVLITDEEDDPDEQSGFGTGSAGDPPQWYKQLLKFKDNREELLVVLSLIGTPEPNECAQTVPSGQGGNNMNGAEIGKRLADFTKMFKDRGTVGDVCAEDYSEFFKKAVNILKDSCEDIPPG